MKKTLTILSLLSVLFLIGCEESELKEIESKLNGTHFTLSTEETSTCTVDWLDDGINLYRNGELYNENLPNQTIYGDFSVDMLENDVWSNGYGETFHIANNGDGYTISEVLGGGNVVRLTDVQVGEDSEGHFVTTKVECQEGLVDHVYRLEILD